MPQNLQDVITVNSNTIFGFLQTPPNLGSTVKLPLPMVMKIDVADWHLSDEQFEQLSAANPEWKIELNGRGEMIIMPSTGFIPGVKSNELSFLVTLWSKQDGIGIVGDSSTMYILPNGAKRSPDVSWVLRERLKRFTQKELQKYAPFAPDFVIELRSPTDSLKELKEKMAEYAENGVRLGWLIDPQKKQVHIYRPDTELQILESPQTLNGEDVLVGFTLNLSEIWSTKIG